MTKKIILIVLIALGAYGALAMSSTQGTTATVEKSLDRMQAVEANLK